MGIQRTHQCLLCKKSTFVKGSTDSNPYNHRRAWIRACCLNNFQNEIFDSLKSCRWLEHTNHTHILTSEAFRAHCDLHFIARNDFCINHSRCIVSCVSTTYRIFYNRFAKISVCISAAYTFIDGISKISANKVHILSDFQEHTCHSCILTDRYIFVICNIKILDNIVKNTLGNLSVFACATCFDSAFYVFRKMFVCFDTEFFDDVCKSAYFYFTHFGKLPSFIYGIPPKGDISFHII